MNVKIIIPYLLERLSETSTIRSLILLGGSIVGYQPSESLINNLVFIILGLAGLLGASLPDNIKLLTKKEEETTSSS
jgi:hypothetical protein